MRRHRELQKELVNLMAENCNTDSSEQSEQSDITEQSDINEVHQIDEFEFQTNSASISIDRQHCSDVDACERDSSDDGDEYFGSDCNSSGSDSDNITGSSADSSDTEDGAELLVKRNNSDKLARCAIEYGLNVTQVNGVSKLLSDFGISVFKDARTIMKTPTSKLNDENLVHFGLADGLFRKIINGIESGSCIINLQFNIDGVPVYRSSKKALWPILCRVVNANDKKPFCVSCFCGTSKPDFSDYLMSFIDEFNNLHDNGLRVHDKHYTIKLLCIICDAPARSALKDITAHTGYSACERCETRGIRFQGRQTFQDFDAPLRTDSSFRQQTDTMHHHKKSKKKLAWKKSFASY